VGLWKWHRVRVFAFRIRLIPEMNVLVPALGIPDASAFADACLLDVTFQTDLYHIPLRNPFADLVRHVVEITLDFPR